MFEEELYICGETLYYRTYKSDCDKVCVVKKDRHYPFFSSYYHRYDSEKATICNFFFKRDRYGIQVCIIRKPGVINNVFQKYEDSGELYED